MQLLVQHPSRERAAVMKERPILFSAPMVRALLDGRKTQTRRLATSPLRRCEPGDRLWVKETWNAFVLSQDGECSWPMATIAKRDPREDEGRHHVVIDFPVAGLPGTDGGKGPFRPSIHMPRWASRLTLIVEAARVESLQAISEQDALAEGTQEPSLRELGDELAQAAWSERQVYQRLWQFLHEKPGQRWEDNPEVLVLTFRVERGNIDRLAA